MATSKVANVGSQQFVQTGLASGMSAASGIHKTKANPVDPKTGVPIGQQHLLPQDWVPTRDIKFPHKAVKDAIQASPICIGAWSWGDTATFSWKPEERPHVDELWDVCQKHGINFIDTAQFYGDGESEQIVGELARKGKREDLVIQTKYYVPAVNPTNILHPKDAPIIKLRNSLERMKLDYVDIYLVHGPIHFQTIGMIAKSMADCVEQGLAKAIGVANYSKEDMIQIEEELQKYGVPLCTNQVEYSPIRRHPELHGLLEECKKRDIVLQSYSTLAQGRLSGKYTIENPPPKNRQFSAYPMEDLVDIQRVLGNIATNRGKSMASVVINYNLSKGVLPVVGMRNKEQAEDDCQALGWRLTADEVKQIDEVSIEGGATRLWQQG